MKCDRCKQRDATVHYTEVTGEGNKEIHLCEICAKKEGIEKSPVLSNFLAGIAEETVGDVPKEDKTLQCPECSLSYGEFRRIGRLGCPHCYEAFSKKLKPLLRRLHGSTRHIGKSVLTGDGKKDELRALRLELEQSIGDEAYEEAAKIRDRIRKVMKEKKKNS
jgi:protein arginine kinase activator